MDIFSPIQQLANFVTFQLLALTPESYLGKALNFFIYDLIKIGLMLILINYLMAIVRYYIPIEKVRSILAKRHWYGLDYLLAALLGVATPFCSCSSIPLFMGFLSAGIPVGVTFTFLISSPLINESSLYLFPAIFGWRVSILYNLIGIAVSIIGGILIQKLGMEKYVQPDFLKFKSKQILLAEYQDSRVPWPQLIRHWNTEALSITKRIFPYVLLGVGLGALIHGYLPTSIITQYLSHREWWVIPIVTLLGVPIYANSVSVIPMMEALVGKGAALGSALAFMTATVTLSLPEALMLKKLMKWPLLITFFGITTVGIMLMGYVFNWLG